MPAASTILCLLSILFPASVTGQIKFENFWVFLHKLLIVWNPDRDFAWNSRKLRTYIIDHLYTSVYNYDINMTFLTPLVCVNFVGCIFMRNFSWELFSLSQNFLSEICWEEVTEEKYFSIFSFIGDVWPGT